jgi:hypothetical protein
MRGGARPRLGTLRIEACEAAGDVDEFFRLLGLSSRCLVKAWWVRARPTPGALPGCPEGRVGSFADTRSNHVLKKFAGAAVVLVLAAGIALADAVRGIITKVDDKEVTVVVRKKGEKKGETKTFKLAEKVKFSKRKGKDDKEDSTLSELKKAIENSKGKTKGVRGTVEVKDEKVTEITFGGGRKGRGKKGK